MYMYVSLRPVHHPRKSLSERHPKRGWTARAHQARAGVSLPNFLPFPRIVHVGGPVRGICEFDTLFSIFSCFWYPKRDTPGGENIPFLRGWCTGPNETYMYPPPPSPPGAIGYVHNDNLPRDNIALQYVIQNNCRKVWWCFLMIFCTFWRSRRRKKLNSPKLSCGFKFFKSDRCQFYIFKSYIIISSPHPVQLKICLYSTECYIHVILCLPCDAHTCKISKVFQVRQILIIFLESYIIIIAEFSYPLPVLVTQNHLCKKSATCKI